MQMFTVASVEKLSTAGKHSVLDARF